MQFWLVWTASARFLLEQKTSVGRNRSPLPVLSEQLTQRPQHPLTRSSTDDHEKVQRATVNSGYTTLEEALNKQGGQLVEQKRQGYMKSSKISTSGVYITADTSNVQQLPFLQSLQRVLLSTISSAVGVHFSSLGAEGWANNHRSSGEAGPLLSDLNKAGWITWAWTWAACFVAGFLAVLGRSLIRSGSSSHEPLLDKDDVLISSARSARPGSGTLRYEADGNPQDAISREAHTIRLSGMDFYVFTLFATCMFVILWAILYALPAEAYWVFLWALVSFVKIPIVAQLNFYVGASWFLPVYLGMTQEEVSMFYSPSQIPTTEWIERYGSRKIKVRDSLQRKIPHFLYGFLDIAIWSGTMYAAVLSPAAVLAMQCAYRALYTTVLFLYIDHHERGGAWPSWFLSHQWRIRDGNLRFENQVAVTFGTLWGVIVTKLLWIFSLVPLYASSERSLLLQLCFLPVAVGDAFAEIVGSCFGSYEFEVTGVGDVNRKTLEGVLAMFITTLVSCTGAVWFAESRGDLTGESLTSWLIVAAVISLLSTVMETYSPRSTDNFTIPLSGYFVLRTYAFVGGI